MLTPLYGGTSLTQSLPDTSTLLPLPCNTSSPPPHPQSEAHSNPPNNYKEGGGATQRGAWVPSTVPMFGKSLVENACMFETPFVGLGWVVILSSCK